ncbi:MAG: hypothetical protein KDA92_24195, partial [Planctomycetales bacterium]|nr:hypothetical protein [Planctomycetales bacterium]
VPEPVPALPSRVDVADRGGVRGADQLLDGTAATDDGLGLEPPPETPKSLDVGRFLDRQQVLIKQDPAAQIWQRVPTGERLHVGDVLMSLPTYRVPLVLASGMQVNLIGATQLELIPPDHESTPRFQIERGRLLVATFAQSGTKFGLRWGTDREALITLADMNTTLAIELQHRHLPGTDPTNAAPHAVLKIIVTSGSANWESAGNPALQVAAGQRLVAVDQLPGEVTDVAQMPSWIDGSDARPRDAIAARTLSEKIAEGRPVSLVLQEETEGLKLDNRSLAICSLAYLGDPAPLIVALNDPSFRAYWNAQYETLTDVVASSNEAANQVRSSLVQRHGADQGEKVFRVLWGYSPAQLQEGGAAELVRCLDDANVDMRLLANEQLKEITGQPSLFRANAGERDAQRRAATVRWRKLLDANGISYAELPELVKLLQTAEEQTQP